MRFEIIKIEPYIQYSFIIGTWEKPDRTIKDQIRSQIGTAMEALGREPDSYSVTVLHDPGGTRGDVPEEPSQYPELGGRGRYLLFGILSNSSGDLSDSELEEQREDLERGLFLPIDSKLALVLLRDSSVSLITTRLPGTGRLSII